MAQPKLISSTTFKIEKNVPLPVNSSGPRVYPFHQMDVGDSFVGPRKAGPAAYSYAKKYGLKFRTKPIDPASIRIWRTA